MTLEEWDQNIDEYVDESERSAKKLEEERSKKDKMKEPMTEESNIDLSANEENERALKLGLLHSRIDAFQAAQPPPPSFDQTTEAGGSSSVPETGGSSTIPEPTATGTGVAMTVYVSPTVSPADIVMEDEGADHMDTEVPYLLSVEEMEIREKAQEEEMRKKHEAEEARLAELEQAKLDERIRLEESRKAEVAAKLAEEQRLQAELAEAQRLKAEAEKLAEEQ